MDEWIGEFEKRAGPRLRDIFESPEAGLSTEIAGLLEGLEKKRKPIFRTALRPAGTFVDLHEIAAHQPDELRAFLTLGPASTRSGRRKRRAGLNARLRGIAAGSCARSSPPPPAVSYAPC